MPIVLHKKISKERFLCLSMILSVSKHPQLEMNVYDIYLGSSELVE